MIDVSGVRNSWLMVDRKVPLATLAASAWTAIWLARSEAASRCSLARISSACARFCSVMSTMTVSQVFRPWTSMASAKKSPSRTVPSWQRT